MARHVYIPMDIVRSILCRLPVKSLLRFKSVSKSWNTMISDHVFIHAHLQQSKNSNSANLYFGKSPPAKTFPENYTLLRFEDRKFHTETALQGPRGWIAMLCSSNGVVLLYDIEFNNFHLWNPSIRTSTKLYFPFQLFLRNYGLCYDPILNDFKIVVAYDYCYAVYSTKKKSWRKVTDCAYTAGMRNGPGLFVNGAIYWLSIKKEVVINNIVYFDPRDEEFKLLEKPKDLKNTDEISLFCLRDRLCVWFNEVEELMVKIWIKEEGCGRDSWTKLMTIEDVMMPLLFISVCFQENKIVMNVSCARFLVYSLDEKKFEDFKDCELNNIGLIPYMDSLMFFNTLKILPQRKRKRCVIK